MMKYKTLYIILVLSCIAGQNFAQSPKEIHSWLPLIKDWTISPEIEVFDSDNLYERINGAAPLFLENNFREMTSLVYTCVDDYITIQAYRHATPEDAFGMYASERSLDMTFYPDIGGEAQGDDYGLFFFSGSVYVKMSSNNKSDAITKIFREIAKSLSAKIDTDASYPAIFDLFPKDGLITHSQAYITKNYIGHEFLKPVYTTDYDLNGLKFQLFVIDGKTKEDAKKVLDDYFGFTKQSLDFIEGNLCVEDRYNGNIPVVWRGQYVIGAFRENGENFPKEIYDFLNRFNNTSHR
ncbi:MAG: hypothetical protein LBS55_00295 [Prevotellaceae bacterium]|jgi:hypothetical protein|nr:hypothetical protein [Prevotellaceae bacterium]